MLRFSIRVASLIGAIALAGPPIWAEVTLWAKIRARFGKQIDAQPARQGQIRADRKCVLD